MCPLFPSILRLEAPGSSQRRMRHRPLPAPVPVPHTSKPLSPKPEVFIASHPGSPETTLIPPTLGDCSLPSERSRALYGRDRPQGNSYRLGKHYFLWLEVLLTESRPLITCSSQGCSFPTAQPALRLMEPTLSPAREALWRRCRSMRAEEILCP